MVRYTCIVCLVCISDSRSAKETPTTILACGYERPVIQFHPCRSRQRTDPSVFEQRTQPVQVVGPEMTDKTPCQRKYYLLLPCAISRILVTCTLFLHPSRKSQQQCVFARPRTRIAFGATMDASWSLKADSHIACRAHVVPVPCPCHAVPLRVFRMCLSHLIYTVRPCLIHTCHAMTMPFPCHAVPLRV